MIAAEFVNTLAEALVAKQAELLNVPGAFQTVWFDVQRKQLEEEVQKAASRLETRILPAQRIGRHRAPERRNEITGLSSREGGIQ